MFSMERAIDVDVPLRAAYDQWMQFETFPYFMEGVREVRRLGDRRVRWRADVGGRVEEWDAELIELEPGRRIAWRSTSGARNDGMVSFQPLDADRTEVTLRLDYEPQSTIEDAGDELGFVERRVVGALEGFKRFVEGRGAAHGAERAVGRAGDAVAAGLTEGQARQRNDHGGVTGGLFTGPGDGTIGRAGDELRERMSDAGEERRPESRDDRPRGDVGVAAERPIDPGQTMGGAGAPAGGMTSGSPVGGTEGITAGKGSEELRTGGINTSTGRGQGSAVAGAVGGGSGGGSGGGTGDAGGGQGIVSDIDSSATGRGRDAGGTGGGVAVSPGRGSDVGDADHAMASDAAGISGGTTGGSRESDLGGGLSGGMRSGQGTDVTGGMGQSTPESTKRETTGRSTGRKGTSSPDERRKDD